MEEYFSVPMQIARRKLSGLRDSLVASSVWRPEFKKPLETYPQFELTRLDFAIPQCDACNLGGRVSTILGRLSGTPYSPLDFEVGKSCVMSIQYLTIPQPQFDDSDSDSESGGSSKDEEDVRRGVQEHTRKVRGAALVDAHIEKEKAKGNSMEGEKDLGIWDHGRDMAVSGRLMDDSQRNKMIRDAKSLGDRFGSGSSGGFL